MAEVDFKIEYYKDVKGEWRWRLRALNGNILANGGEGYKRKKDMLTILDRMQFDFEYAEREEVAG